jgi:hypothetical protein
MIAPLGFSSQHIAPIILFKGMNPHFGQLLVTKVKRDSTVFSQTGLARDAKVKTKGYETIPEMCKILHSFKASRSSYLFDDGRNSADRD